MSSDKGAYQLHSLGICKKGFSYDAASFMDTQNIDVFTLEFDHIGITL